VNSPGNSPSCRQKSWQVPQSAPDFVPNEGNLWMHPQQSPSQGNMPLPAFKSTTSHVHDKKEKNQSEDDAMARGCLPALPTGGGILATFFVTRNPRQFSLHSDVSSPFAARLCPGCRRCAIAYEPAPTDAPCAEVCGAHDARSQHPRAADDTGGESGGESSAAATHQRGGGVTFAGRNTLGLDDFLGASCWMI